MATSPRRSLASRAGAAARKVVRKSSSGQASKAAKAGKAAANGTARKAAPAKTAAKKAPAKKAVAKKTPAKTAAKKTTTTKTPAKKITARAAAKKTATTQAPAKKTAAKKAAAKKTAAKKTAAAKAPAKKAPAKQAAVKKASGKKAPAKKAATKAPAKKAPAKKAPAKGPKATATKAEARKLVVLEQEDPWTKEELTEVRTQLRADVQRLGAELAVAEEDLVGLMREGSDGAGNDQADVGTATFERDQELTIANNARDMLQQSEHALARIADGTYGVCESCGNPIGKNRLMAFPRATMCMTCKQRQERR